MFGKNATVLDVAVGATLALALTTVFVVDRITGKGKTPTAASHNSLPFVEIRGGQAKDADGKRRIARNLRLAVTPSHPTNPNNFNDRSVWDDMGKLLREMGDDYQFREIHPAMFAGAPEMLDNIDVLFLTCSPQVKGENLSNALVRFVKRGGTLYASDWRFDDVAAAFPMFVDNRLVGQGMGKQHVTAEVVDPGLREYLHKPSVPLYFDLNLWKTAAFAGPKVTTLLKGRYRQVRADNRKVVPGNMAEAPLLVKFNVGKGTVIFTSFHNEKQNSDVEKELLQFLVFTVVVAEIDAQLTAEITEAGFEPQKSNLLTTTRESSVTNTFRHAKAGPLRVSLGFRDAGVTLQLVLVSPDGRSCTWKGNSTVTLEVPDAVAGEWSYTITADNIPRNFPFTVTVSQKK